MFKKAKLKISAAILLTGISASALAVWANAFTVVYYTDASKTQVSGYVMHYCQSMFRTLVGTKTAHVAVLDGGSCQGNGVPPAP